MKWFIRQALAVFIVLLRLYCIAKNEGSAVLIRKLWRRVQIPLLHKKGSQAHSAVAIASTGNFAALVVDNYMPTPDRDSGSLRLFHLLLILQKLDFEVTFAAANLEAPAPSLTLLQRHGIICLSRPTTRSLAQHLAAQGHRYTLVILSRADTATALMPQVRRHCPHAQILFDTVDLHFLREERQAILDDSRANRWLAAWRKQQELALVDAADATLVVSPVELALLRAERPQAQLHCVSNIHHIPGSAAPFAARRNLLFIGAFSHLPNADAVRWLLRDILPLVHAAIPEVHCHVIGANPPADIQVLASAQVRIHGHVPNVQPFFAQCRLSVAPLRYGAGVKGKINQSLAHGLPVVATQIAAEGMFLIDDESALIADDAIAFAAAIVRLYRDEACWQRLSTNGITVMEQHFSVEAAQHALQELIHVRIQ
ncbi:glycosyltransferase [Chromatium okenii]|uniref:Glycosyltransferase n=1 Tax=Chromatium okenii TaxID=61644 RepID=A0A2S7XTD2_9GAMM|nr:glycosyltransferase [Chromatium okenii]PQJ96672.1 hypothetical protein CXB77_07805 [Chromatium okenii]